MPISVRSDAKVGRSKRSQLLLKKENRQLVLDVIRRNGGPMSRSEIARITRLTKVTVSSLVEELINKELVAEIGSGPSTLGRRPVLLSFRPSAAHVLGVQLTPEGIVVALLDLSFNIVKVKHFSRPLTTHTEDAVKAVLYAIREIVHGDSSSFYGLVGIGVAVTGFVDYLSGTVVKAVNLPLSGINLSAILSDEFAVPVFVDNEANTAAWGEFLFGVAKDSPSVAYVSAGVGLGVGFVLRGEVYRGILGLAGEMGHMTIMANGLRCLCGNRGCWEMYGSEKFLERFCKESGLEPDPKVDIVGWLMQLADDGEPRARQAFEAVGEYLGIGIANIANTLNPDVVVLGNKLAGAWKWLSGTMQDVARERSLDPIGDRLRLVRSSNPELASVLGAGALAVEHFLQDDDGRLWA